MLGPPHALPGWTELTAAQQAVLAPWLEHQAEGSDVQMGGLQDSQGSDVHMAGSQVSQVGVDAAGGGEAAGDAVQDPVRIPDLPGHELRNMAWWSSPFARGWLDGALLNQGMTLSEVPGKLQFAVAEAREVVASWTQQAPDDDQRLAGWRLFLLIDRFLFAELYSETELEQSKPVAERVGERLDLFWAGEWEILFRLTAVHRKLRSSGSQVQRTVRRIRQLLRNGELGKACQAAWGAAEVRDISTTGAAFHEQQGLPHGTLAVDGQDAAIDPVPAASVDQARVLASDMERALMASWAHVPRGSGPGPMGDRYEHWIPMGGSEDSGQATARMLSQAATGEVPAAACDLLFAAKLAGLAKISGGTRVVASGGVPRRLLAKAACSVRGAEIQQAVGSAQFGVGVSAGAEALQKVVTAAAEELPDFVFASIDVKSAFRRCRRRELFRALRRRCPDLELLARTMYDRPGQHVLRGDGEASDVVRQVLGLDEGCPLSPAFFAILLADPLSAFRRELQAMHARADAVAYLDDIYFWVPRDRLEQAMQLARLAVNSIGLELNVAKTKLWFPSGAPAGIPAALQPHIVQELPCLGSTVLYVRSRRFQAEDDDWRDVSAGADGSAQVERALVRLTDFADRLDILIRAGLAKHDAWAMLTNFVNGAVTYAQRAQASDPQQWRRYDDQVVNVVGRWLGAQLSDLSRRVLFTPAKLGGGGLASAEARGDAAFLGSWAQVEDVVYRSQRVETAAQSELAAPQLHQAVRSATERVRAAGGSAAVRTQRAISQSLVAKRRQQLAEGLEDDPAALLQSQAVEGGAWLRAPRRDRDVLSDDAFCVCIRRRLLFEDPAGQGPLPCMLRARGVSRACGCTTRHRWGSHAVCCEKGPGFARRHNYCRDELAEWCCEHVDSGTLKEQHVPRWDRPGARGPERAVLDVVVHANPAGSSPLYIDVSVTEPTSADAGAARARARRPGLAAADRERTKHSRYPGELLLPAVLETGGRWGREFRRWARAVLPEGPRRSEQLAELRYRLAVALQRGVAAALLAASAGAVRPWNSPAPGAGGGWQ